MRTCVILSLFLLLMVCLAGPGAAQGPPEDHFKVYNIAAPIQYPGGPFELIDQFGNIVIDLAHLEKIATPAVKNFEPFFDLERHQTWWRIDQP